MILENQKPSSGNEPSIHSKVNGNEESKGPEARNPALQEERRVPLGQSLASLRGNKVGKAADL